MKMSDVRPGMRLRGIYSPFDLITVTALTPRGFTYDLDAPRRIMPMLTMEQHGHEHYGYNGESCYEPLDAPPREMPATGWDEVLVTT